MDYVGFAEKLFVRLEFRSQEFRSSGVQEFRSSGVRSSGVRSSGGRSQEFRRKKKEERIVFTNYHSRFAHFFLEFEKLPKKQEIQVS
ncbi:MAG: hypothetical protein PT118_14310 [Aphanizomenon gracile PMC644.10]|nr:hypothetical protein [Aphanizomenon gracile PMC644.10]